MKFYLLVDIPDVAKDNEEAVREALVYALVGALVPQFDDGWHKVITEEDVTFVDWSKMRIGPYD
jgi:hypothetical protein